MKRTLIIAASFIMAGFCMPAAQAGSVTATVTVSLSITGVCSVAGGSLNFGSAPQGTTATLRANANIDVTCPNGAAYNVLVDDGLHYSTAAGARKMYSASSGDVAGYYLSRNAAFTQAWGHTVGTDTLSGVGTGSVQSITLYGGTFDLRAAQPVASDYSDTVTITVQY